MYYSLRLSLWLKVRKRSNLPPCGRVDQNKNTAKCLKIVISVTVNWSWVKVKMVFLFICICFTHSCIRCYKILICSNNSNNMIWSGLHVFWQPLEQSLVIIVSPTLRNDDRGLSENHVALSNHIIVVLTGNKVQLFSPRWTRDILFYCSSDNENNNSSRVHQGEKKSLYYRLIRNFIFLLDFINIRLSLLSIVFIINTSKSKQNKHKCRRHMCFNTYCILITV